MPFKANADRRHQLSEYLGMLDLTYRSLREDGWRGSALASRAPFGILAQERFLSREMETALQVELGWIWRSLPIHFGARAAAERKPDSEGLNIVRVSMKSPIELALSAPWLDALVLAVILSGGKIKLGAVEFQLPPIGKSIAELRRSLSGKGLPDKRKQPRIRDRIERPDN